ncbi:MAG: hypothetical protein IJE82_00345 [Alphaproteobacteria bacterium]|nr:hypothetical protein [Alphaproteobacteria bacterium]
MALPKKSVIFNTLNAKRHRIDEDTQFSLFPDICANTPTIHSEYWYYSDLHNLFGEHYFPIAPNMNAHAWENLVMPTQTKQQRSTPQLIRTDLPFYDGHIATIRHEYTLDHSAYKNAKDLRLSRYACWCMSRGKPSMIFSRTYFISPIINPHMSFDDMKNLSYQFARVHLRDKLTHYEKIFAGILKKHNADFRQFNHAMTRAFFYNYSANDLKEIHRIQIKPNDPLANYMGAATLNARINALHNTIEKFKHTHKQNIATFEQIAYNELINARVQEIHDHNIRHEQDIFQTPISQVQSELSRTERDFILKYSNEKIR